MVEAIVQVTSVHSHYHDSSSTSAYTYFCQLLQYSMTVGATDIEDKRAAFSNYGKCVDIFGPVSCFECICLVKACIIFMVHRE